MVKIKIVNCWTSRYRRSDQHFVPSLTLAHLAALAPDWCEVTLHHEQVRPVNVEQDVAQGVQLAALTFPTGFALHAYRLADDYRRHGIPVVMGGPHVTFLPEEALRHADAVAIGEAEVTWPQLLRDFRAGRMWRVYRTDQVHRLAGLPLPRYDLIEPAFAVPHVVQATRGCPYHCKFCATATINPGFRMRPVDEVIRDIVTPRFSGWLQNKLVWFWDDNLTANRRYAKSLLHEMIPLRKWWLTQASLDLTEDEELLKLMHASGCVGVFLGIETLDADALASVSKQHNRVSHYRQAIRKLHDHGIAVMAGLMMGFDTDTRASLDSLLDQVRELEIDAPFLSVLTPYYGTQLYDEMLQSDRILLERDWTYYAGYGVSFRPAQLTVRELEAAHARLWQALYAPPAALARWWHGLMALRPGALVLSTALNGHYGLSRLTGNVPVQFREADTPLECLPEQSFFARSSRHSPVRDRHEKVLAFGRHTDRHPASP
jgi:radical SAM superfamily enzyme YgiQ (UPF0313 family)